MTTVGTIAAIVRALRGFAVLVLMLLAAGVITLVMLFPMILYEVTDNMWWVWLYILYLLAGGYLIDKDLNP